MLPITMFLSPSYGIAHLGVAGLACLLAGCSLFRVMPAPVTASRIQAATSAAAHPQVLAAGSVQSDRITFVNNRRDPALYDVYTADSQSGHVELLLENSGDVVQWVMDIDGSIGARVRRQDSYRILQVRSKPGNTWKSVYKWTDSDIVWPLRIDRAAGVAILMSNVGRDRAELLELKLAAHTAAR